jgi:hypothetical protein
MPAQHLRQKSPVQTCWPTQSMRSALGHLRRSGPCGEFLASPIHVPHSISMIVKFAR